MITIEKPWPSSLQYQVLEDGSGVGDLVFEYNGWVFSPYNEETFTPNALRQIADSIESIVDTDAVAR